jgi:hypothetical protein
MNEARRTENLVRDVEPGRGGPGELARGCGLGRRPAGGVPIERDVSGKLPIAGAGVAGAGNRAIGHGQRLLPHAEPFGGGGEEQRAGLGADVTDGGAAILDREAARRDALVRALPRPWRDETDTV